MKAGTDPRYRDEFRDAAVKQVTEGGRSLSAAARSLETPNRTLANWVLRSRKPKFDTIRRKCLICIGASHLAATTTTAFERLGGPSSFRVEPNSQNCLASSSPVDMWAGWL